MEPDATVLVKCRECRRVTDLEVRKEDFVAWKAGELIQEAMPYLSDDERELLISGTCGSCFDAMFPEEV